jgi:ribosome-associated toxin RatA of RatAB toxin-antitoxin module
MRGVIHVNQMHKIRNLLKILTFIVIAAILFSAGSASAVEKLSQNEDVLLETYHRNTAKFEKNSSGFPLFLESFERDDRVHVDVYGVFDQPFSSIVNVLNVPANWCDIVSIHTNVKACTYRELPGTWQLTFYIGRKVYQPAKDAHQVVYNYRKVVQQQRYMDINLNAEEGPFGTKDHRMRFEALPLDGGKTFVHVHYEYNNSVALRVAEKIYFATLGLGKVGFTVTGTNKKGNPVYIGGPRGAIERNAVRYYFAIQSFMNTLRYPEKIRFRMRIIQWYDLTIRYRKQLFDLDRKDYLAFKTMEHMNQVMLQRSVGTVLQ